MTELLPAMDGEARSREFSQWFTPPALARQVVDWAGIESGSRVLEPAAGRGALLTEIFEHAFDSVAAFEIDPLHREHLRQTFFGAKSCSCCSLSGDFLAWEPDKSFELAIMNPPYEGNQDVAFVDHALKCCNRVVGIFAARIVHSKGRKAFWAGIHIRRMAILSERPRFGGEHSARTDFVVMELLRRPQKPDLGQTFETQIEWW